MIDLTDVSALQVGGRGGSEESIGQLLPSWKRVNDPLYDFQVLHDGATLKLEVKKQKNLQWFDSGKYYRLSTSDRRIRLLFVCHDGKAIEKILAVQLGEFIDWLCSHRQRDGWSEEVMKVAAEFKKRYPRLQFKAPAKISTIQQEAPDLFQIIWARCAS